MNAPPQSLLPALPIAIPLFAAALLLLVERSHPRVARLLAVAALLATLLCVSLLLRETDSGHLLVHHAGDWGAPFGITLAADRLSALMLLVVATIAIACQLAALDGVATRPPRFAALLQLQLVGLNGAFLTTDLFNLFVFFELLLIASYALLLHEARGPALRAGLHYVTINLLASTLFLIGVSLLYGALGTLSMAELAPRIAKATEAERALATSAVVLLVVVFGVKSAMLPLGFWLVPTYPTASAPVAALFAVMTKVGVYSIARLAAMLGEGAELRMLVQGLALWGGLATLALSTIWVLSARDLRALGAALVTGSAGMLLMLVGLGTGPTLQAALVYLPHTTFASAALFLTADLVAQSRGAKAADSLVAGASSARTPMLGLLFLVCGVTIAGLPPLSGFVSKLFILDAARATSAAWPLIWAIVLGSGLVSLVAFMRAGSVLFWKSSAQGAPDGEPAAQRTIAVRTRGRANALVVLLASTLAIVLGAGPISGFALRAGLQLLEPTDYSQRVLERSTGLR